MKTAFVTGSTRGIGLGIAKELRDTGFTVILSGTKAEPPDILGDFPGGMYVQCRIDDSRQRINALQAILDQYGRVDLLVNNAGIAPDAREDILNTTEESFDKLIRTNTKGTFFLCQIFANKMIQLKAAGLEGYQPRIINISSISAYTSSANRGEYCISKAGIAMITLLFADKLAEYGIPVFEIRPGIIKTDMTSGVVEKYDKFILADKGLPQGRWGLPEDVGKAAAALAGGAFDYSTGQVINVDGGFHIRRL